MTCSSMEASSPCARMTCCCTAPNSAAVLSRWAASCSRRASMRGQVAADPRAPYVRAAASRVRTRARNCVVSACSSVAIFFAENIVILASAAPDVSVGESASGTVPLGMGVPCPASAALREAAADPSRPVGALGISGSSRRRPLLSAASRRRVPCHHRISWRPEGSAYQPGATASCPFIALRPVYFVEQPHHSYGFAAGAVGPGPGPHDASSCRQSEVKCGVPEGSSVSGAPSSLPETEDETTLLHVSALLSGASLTVGVLPDSRPAHPSAASFASACLADSTSVITTSARPDRSTESTASCLPTPPPTAT